MTKNNRLRLAACVLLALTPQLIGLSTFSKAPVPEPVVKSNATYGRLPIELHWGDNAGCLVTFQPPEPELPAGEARLVSIDGLSLRGKSKDEIEMLLLGTVGTKIELELCLHDDTLKKLPLTIRPFREDSTPESREESSYRVALARLLGRADGDQNFSNTVFSMQESDSEQENLELFTIGHDRELLRYARAWPGQGRENLIYSVALSAVSHSITIGDLPASGGYVQIAHDSMQPLEINPFVVERSYLAPIAALNKAGKHDQAELLAADVLKIFDKNAVFERERSSRGAAEQRATLLLYANILKHDKKAEAAAVADKLHSQLGNRVGLNPVTGKALGDLYYDLGDTSRAIECYQSDVKERVAWNKADDMSLSQVAEQAFLFYRLAQFERVAGNESKCKEYLQQAAEIYKKLSEVERSVVDRMPGVFPTPGDIQAAMGGKFHTPADAVGASDISANFKLLSDARNGIEAGDKSKYNAAIDALLKNYSASTRPSNPYPRPALNFYCSLMLVARRLADRGFYDDSNNLLNRLGRLAISRERTPIINFMMQIELALNLVRSGKGNADTWRKLEDLLKASDQPMSESMRRFSGIYYQAGDFERASILHERALKLAQADESSSSAISPQMVLLLLDSACLKAQKGQYDRSDLAFRKALNMVATLPSGTDPGYRKEFGRKYRFKVRELARVNVQKGRQKEAEQLLRDALAKIGSPATTFITDADSRNNYRDGSDSILDAYLGELLCAQKQYPEARIYLDRAIAQCNNIVPGVYRLLRAQCAMATGDYATAAGDFTDASDHCDVFDMNRIDPGYSDYYLRQAIEAAEKVKGYDPVQLAKLYTTAGDRDSFSQRDIGNALKLYQKAYALLPDSAPTKSSVAAKIASTQSSLSYLGGAKIDVDTQLAMLVKAAALTENDPHGGGRLSASDQWFVVAVAEIQADRFDQGIKHAEHAIDIFTVPDSTHDYSRASGTGPSYALASKKRPGDAERLLLLVQKKVESQRGSDSLEAFEQREALFSFYVRTKNLDKAFSTLDQLCVLNPKKLTFDRFAGFSPCETIAETASYLTRTEPKDLDLAKKILSRLLNSQRKYYAADDYRLAKIYAAMASVDELAGNLDATERNYRAASDIECLYGDWSASTSRGRLESILRKEKKDAEADRVRDEGKKADRELENHRVKQLATPAALQEQYDWLHKERPYSSQLKLAIDGLLRTEKDNARIAKLATEAIDIMDHESCVRYRSCTSSAAPAQERSRYFLKAIDAYKALGQTAQVSALLDRALATMSYHPTADEFLFLAEIENLRGNKTAASEYCAKVQISGQPGYFYGPQVIALLKKIGDKEHLDAVTAEVSTSYERETQKRQREQYERERTQQQQKRALAPAWPTPAARPVVPVVPVVSGGSGSTVDAYEPVVQLQQINFKYALLASNSLVFEDPADLMQSGERFRPAASFVGSFGGLTAPRAVNQDGKFSFIFNGPPGIMRTKVETAALSHPPGTSTGIGGNTTSPLTSMVFQRLTAPPPVQSLPFQPAPSAPPGATALGVVKGPLELDPGDYTATTIATNSLIIRKPGRVRIFLADGATPATARTPVFVANNVAFINVRADLPMEDSFNPNKLEIWYNGKGLIKLDERCKFRGLIYAPNARLEMGPGDVVFIGAAVARDIFASGLTKIFYAQALEKWTAE
ncbi:MAG: hypothetical protein JST01_01180 [Cyanobacteria bacterium SZAS TMP-1]|nr:hypothetical protein [Cyanobacteria bacterium SZAS TMP-1]